MANAPHPTETDVDDGSARQIRQATLTGRRSLMELWQQWRSEGRPPVPAALLLAKTLIEIAHPEDALEVLGDDVEGVRADQLRAFALAKTGKIDDSLQLLEKLRADGHFDTETAGLLGGRYKQKWRKSGNPALLQAAYGAYRDSYDTEPASYTGINAASLALALGMADESARLAGEILKSLGAISGSELGYWDVATRGQAQLLSGDLEAAAASYRKVVAADWSAVQNIAIMRREARLDLENLGRPRDALDEVLSVPGIAAFSGHRVDEPDRAEPRFPAEKVGDVRRAIRDSLHDRKIGFGFTSAANGADLLFLEELLERGGNAQVFLPFPRDEFMKISVGDKWKRRFNRVMKDERVEVETVADAAPEKEGLQAAFSACNEAVYEAAVGFATRLDEEAILLAVWDGKPGDGTGGTADSVKLWRDESRPVEIIDIGTKAKPDEAESRTAKPDPPAPGTSRTRTLVPAEAIGAPAPAGPGTYRARRCLCIGIDAYENWTPLQNGENDARAVGCALQERFGFDSVVLESKQATRDGIYRTIAEKIGPGVQEDDLFVLFFAGHGHTEHTPDGQKRGYIVPVDAPNGVSPRLIPMSDLSFWCGYLPCRHILYVFDSCFSGLLTLRSGGDRRTHDMLQRKARVAITSGAADQEVLDVSDTGHSAFTSQLLGGLRGDLVTDRGDFTATELFTFLKERVVRVAEEIGGYQTPTFGQLAGHESGDILFQLPPEG